MTSRTVLASILPLIFAGLLSAYAQTPAPAAKPLEFEIISIRPSQPGALGREPHPDVTADGVHFANLPVLWGILMAYGPTNSDEFGYYTNDLVIGGPEWMRSERYDIDARIADADRAEWQKPTAQKPMLQAMLQAMFAERFKLAVHRAIQDKSTYALMVAKNGPKLKPTDPAAPVPAGISLPGGAVLISNGSKFSFYNAPMATLAIVLSNVSGRPVTDSTGLAGRFDFSFDAPRGGMRAPDPAAEIPGSTPDSGPSLFTLLQDQLGLHLESRKAQVETLVIDHLERPTEN